MKDQLHHRVALHFNNRNASKHSLLASITSSTKCIVLMIIIIMYFCSQTLRCFSEQLFFIRVTLCVDGELRWTVHPRGVKSLFEGVDVLGCDNMRWQRIPRLGYPEVE